MNPEAFAVIENIVVILQCVVLAGSVVAIISSLGKMAAKPNQTQDERLDALELWRAKVEHHLENGNAHFEEIDSGNRITQRSLLALMSHAINGNDIDELRRAKRDLETYLTHK